MSIFQRLWDAIGLNESADELEYEDDSSSTSGWVEPPRSNNIVDMHWSNPHSEMLVVEPRSFEEIPPVVTALKERKSIILNLSLVDADTAQRCVDFVAGGAYAIDGHQERIGETVFLFTPSFVQISSLAAPPVPVPTAPLVPDALPPRRVPPNPTRSLKSLVQDLPDVQ